MDDKLTETAELTPNSLLDIDEASHGHSFPQDNTSSEASADQIADLDSVLDAAEKAKTDSDLTDEDKKPLPDATKPAPDAAKPAPVEPKPAAEQPKSEVPAAAEAEKKPEWKDVGLPTWAAPSTKEAFSLVKEGAKAQISNLTREVTDTKAKLAEYEAKVTKLPADFEAKLARLADLEKEVRFFNIEKDPEFVEKFDKPIEKNHELILAKLAEIKGGPETVARIKEFGGLGAVNIDKVLEQVPTPLRRYIETKLYENATLGDQKNAELQKAKSGADDFFKQKEAAQAGQREIRDKRAIELLNSTLGNQPFMEKKQVPVDATPEVRARIEADNQFSDRARQIAANVLAADDSAEVRAELATAAVLAHHFKAQLDALTAENATLRKASEELAKIKKASSSSRARTSTGLSAVPSKAAQSHYPTSDEALDALLDEAEKGRA
jgi:hypothetical protein